MSQCQENKYIQGKENSANKPERFAMDLYHKSSFQTWSQRIFFSVTTQKISKLEEQWILTEKDYN